MVVNIRELEQAYIEIKDERNRLLEKSEEIKKIKNSITEFSGKDEIILEIQRIENQIFKECYDLKVLCCALKEIIHIYTDAERSIIKKYEERPERTTVKLIDILNFQSPIFDRIIVR